MFTEDGFIEFDLKGSQFAGVFPLEGQFTTITVSFAIRQNHPLFANLSSSLLDLMHHGVIDQIFRNYGGYNHPKATNKNLIPLSVTDIQGVFLIVFVKLGMAVIWVAMKHVYKKREKMYKVIPLEWSLL